MVNLYAWRSSDPRALDGADDPVGPDNDAWLTRTVAGPGVAAVVVGWGARAGADRVAAVLELCAGRPLQCLGRTRDGHPRHPLYLPGGTPLVPYPPAAGVGGVSSRGA